MGIDTTLSLATGRSAAAISLLGGSGAAASEFGVFESKHIETEQEKIHKEVGAYRGWWDDMLKNEKNPSNAGLKNYELQPGACSRGFFSGIKSFNKVSEVNITSTNEPYGCVTINSWSGNDAAEDASKFAAKIETVFVEGNKGLITTTLLMPHDENTNHLKELYLRYELNKEDKTDGRWSVSKGYGWVYSRSTHNQITGIDFSGNGWFGETNKLNVDLSKLCHRKSTTHKNGHQGTSKECGSLEDDKVISNNFKHVEKKLSKSAEGKWSSPFKDYIIKYKKKGDTTGHENLVMWSNGDINSACVNISYKWQDSSWKPSTSGEKAWISRTVDYFDENHHPSTACSQPKK